MNRRPLVTTDGTALVAQADHASARKFETCHTAHHWRERLTENEYLIFRKEETERPSISALTDETHGTAHDTARLAEQCS